MSEKLEEEFGAALGAMVVASLLLTAWLVAKLVEVVVRAWIIAPRNRLLWVATAVCVVLAALVALRAGEVLALNLLAGTALGALLLVSKGIDICYDTLLQRALTVDTLRHEVLHEPWFQLT